MKIWAIMPTYRRAPFKEIERNPLYLAGYSWFNQKEAGPLIIAEDGGSEGYTKKVIKALREYGEVLYFKLREHAGPSGCRNFLLNFVEENVEGKFLFSWEDDCIFLSKNGLRTLRKQLMENKFDVILPSVHTRAINWKKRWDPLHILLGENIPNFSTKVEKPVRTKNMMGVFLARKKVIEKYRFPIVPWPNGWGEETLLALKIKESIGYTSDVIVIHLKFGRRKKLTGEIPQFDYKLPIPYDEILRLSETDIKRTGCKVNMREWVTFKLAALLSIHSLKNFTIVSRKTFKRICSLFRTEVGRIEEKQKEEAREWYTKFLLTSAIDGMLSLVETSIDVLSDLLTEEKNEKRGMQNDYSKERYSSNMNKKS